MLDFCTRPLTHEFFKSAKYRVAGKEVSKVKWQIAARARLGEMLGKKRISIMLDAAIIEYFKSAAGERGYQTRINETLKKAVSGEALASALRLVVREELVAYKVRYILDLSGIELEYYGFNVNRFAKTIHAAPGVSQTLSAEQLRKYDARINIVFAIFGGLLTAKMSAKPHWRLCCNIAHLADVH